MARQWTTPEILRLSAAWQWEPYDAVIREDTHARVVVSGGRATVTRAQPSAELGTTGLIAAVRRLAADADPDATVMWPVHAATEPADLTGELAMAGAKVAEELDVCAVRLGVESVELDPPEAVEVLRIDDPALLADAHRVSAEVFGTPLPTAEFVAAESDNVRAQVAAGPDRELYRYVAYVDSSPVGAAGFTMDDGAAKLWGGSVVEEYRGRGVYRAMLRVRLDEAIAAGADLAMVKARTGTSSPILTRAGFVIHGREYVYSLSASA